MSEASYSEFETVPQWTRALWENEKLLNADDPCKWGGKSEPPAIGARVKCYMNALGEGTVLGYFVEHGWLGVLVRLDTNPAWRERKLGGNPPACLFGVDLEPRAKGGQ